MSENDTTAITVNDHNYPCHVEYEDICDALSSVHIEQFTNFLRQSDITFNLRKIPYRALKCGFLFDQDYVNTYMRFIAAGYEIHPTVEDGNGFVITGVNRAQAFSQMQMLVPVLRIEFPKGDDLTTLVSKFKKWVETDGVNDVDRWIMGSNGAPTQPRQ